MRIHYNIIYFIYSTEVSLLFNTIPEDNAEFIQSQHEFINSVTVKTVLLIGDETSLHHFTVQAKHAGIQFKTAEATVWWPLFPQQ